MAKRRYLVETSATIAVLGYSTEDHNEHVAMELSDGTLQTSVYVRKEFIGRFICNLIEIAENIELHSQPSEALLNWADEFGRKTKIGLNLVAWLLERDGKITNSRQLSVQVCDVVLDLLSEFDLRLEIKGANTCGCIRGKFQVNVDYREGIVRQLSDLRKQFLEDVTDCEVNHFLGFTDVDGRIASILGSPEVIRTKRIRDAIHLPLTKIRDAGAPVTCSSCRNIGDPIIALEQPKHLCLAHLDRSFDTLCEITGRDHKLLRGRRSFQPKRDEKSVTDDDSVR